MPPAAGAIRGTPPETQAPQLCSIAEEPPEGEDWVSEIKLDGYRLIVSVDHGTVRLLTRNGHDWADRLLSVAKAMGALNDETAMHNEWRRIAREDFRRLEKECGIR